MRIYALTSALLVIFGLALGAPQPGLAQSGIYTVTDVAVDRTADTATEARELAIADGHVAAWKKLFQEVLDGRNAPKYSADEISLYVLAFSVDNERTSPGRYIANMTFRFLAEDVNALLGDRGDSLQTADSPPVLILPLFSHNGVNRLWDDPNPWRNVWGRGGRGGGVVPVMVPVGDLADVAAIDADSALRGDPGALNVLTQRYGAASALVSQSILNGDPAAGNASVNVITRADGRYLTSPLSVTIDQGPGDSLETMLDRAAASIESQLQSSWARASTAPEIPSGPASYLTVEVRAATLKQWLSVKRQFTQIPQVQNARVIKLSKAGSEVELAFAGTTDQLSQAFAQRNMSLYYGDDAKWILTPGGTSY